VASDVEVEVDVEVGVFGGVAAQAGDGGRQAFCLKQLGSEIEGQLACAFDRFCQGVSGGTIVVSPGVDERLGALVLDLETGDL
jgi:hypothetical protein